MTFQYLAGATYRALTARKDGPSLYDVCDPLLLNQRGGDPHLSKFYQTALGNPALRPLLRRTGLSELRDEPRLRRLREALIRARDDETPDWAAIGAPVAELLDTIDLGHPRPAPAAWPRRAPDIAEIEAVIRTCGAHLLRSFARSGFIPTYAAFNLIGDADLRGRELLMALTGLNSRSYKNSTLLFNLARIFISRSPARALVNPPWRGVAEPMWEPMQIRHRSAYYDAFFTETLLSFVETGLASADQTAASRAAISEMVDFCLTTSREEVRAQDGSPVSVITALAPLPHPRFSKFFAQIKQDLGFGVYVPDCDTTACSFSAATQAGSTDPILTQPLLDFYAGYQVRGGDNAPRVTVPINDHIDYEGGVATWIDNLAGERPFGNDLDPTLNLDILEVSFRNLVRWKIIETPQRLDTVHRIIGFQKAARRQRRVYQSAVAYLLPAGALLRLFRPLLRSLPRAADCRAADRRPRRRLQFHPWPGAGLCADRVDRARDERVRCGAGAGHARSSRRRSRNLYACPALYRYQSWRGRPAWAVQGLRMEQDEDPDAHPGRRPRGHLGLRADGANAGATGHDAGGGRNMIQPSLRSQRVARMRAR